MICSNLVMLSLLAHVAKSISSSKVTNYLKSLVWIIGCFIFLISLAVAFTGYVVVSGNMSYWAALVILNLVTVIPVIGEYIVETILCGSAVTSWAIKRFTQIHFAVAVAASLLAVVHILILHKQSPSRRSSEWLVDGSDSLVIIIIKDMLGIMCFLQLCLVLVLQV